MRRTEVGGRCFRGARVSQIRAGILGNATGWKEMGFSTESLRGQVSSRGAKAYIMSTGPQRTRPSALRKRIRKFVWRVLKMGGQALRVPERHRPSSTIREYGKASENTPCLLMTGQIQTRA